MQYKSYLLGYLLGGAFKTYAVLEVKLHQLKKKLLESISIDERCTKLSDYGTDQAP